MSELEKKILENQVKLLKAMDEAQKQRYMDFTEGMLAMKQRISEEN